MAKIAISKIGISEVLHDASVPKGTEVFMIKTFGNKHIGISFAVRRRIEDILGVERVDARALSADVKTKIKALLAVVYYNGWDIKRVTKL